MREYDEPFMQEIVYHLDGDWRAAYDFDRVKLYSLDSQHLTLVDGDGQRFAQAVDRGKIVVWASFGDYSGYADRKFQNTIRISKAKGAAKIAAEIRRRLLLGYWEEFAAAKAKKQAADDRAANRAAQMQELADITEGWTYTNHSNWRRDEPHDAMNSKHIGAEFSYDDTFKLSVKGVPADVVADLVWLIHHRLQGHKLATAA
ncbi:hypothetical protein [Nocardia terpenica]|uniref:Uncharacterized protein n=1 Tax=Nocardia terpenica TaxID=455432 RepID=A0A164LCI9_9NOCA|nr:hypothetical protein [Nocardia terpenica]KZM72257.1 hypothetical protein AWN90_36900 [Nocardia terpenica]NQE86597.1 hypothetical protein [Nocardia terpenica]